jgi:hypothetical protein
MTYRPPKRHYGARKRTKAALRADEVMRQCWSRKPEDERGDVAPGEDAA